MLCCYTSAQHDHLWPDASCPRLQHTCDDIPLNSTPSHVTLLSYVNVFKNTSNLSSAAAPLYKTKGQRRRSFCRDWVIHDAWHRLESRLAVVWNLTLRIFSYSCCFFSAPGTQGRRTCNVWLCSTERRWHESERPSQHFLNLFSNDIPWNTNLSLQAELGSIRSDVWKLGLTRMLTHTF